MVVNSRLGEYTSGVPHFYCEYLVPCACLCMAHTHARSVLHCLFGGGFRVLGAHSVAPGMPMAAGHRPVPWLCMCMCVLSCSM